LLRSEKAALIPGIAPKRDKKGAAVAGGSKVDNREASNRVDRSHSMSMKMDT
jgi:hypothetical protein